MNKIKIICLLTLAFAGPGVFADASRGYGVTGIVNKVAGDVRFLRDTTREIDLWQVFFAKELVGACSISSTAARST